MSHDKEVDFNDAKFLDSLLRGYEHDQLLDGEILPGMDQALLWKQIKAAHNAEALQK